MLVLSIMTFSFLSYFLFSISHFGFPWRNFFHTKKKRFHNPKLTFRFQALYLRPRWVPLGLSRSFTCHFTISSEKRRRPVCPPLLKLLRQSKVFLQDPKAQFLWGVVEALLTRSKKTFFKSPTRLFFENRFTNTPQNRLIFKLDFLNLRQICLTYICPVHLIIFLLSFRTGGFALRFFDLIDFEQ